MPKGVAVRIRARASIVCVRQFRQAAAIRTVVWHRHQATRCRHSSSVVEHSIRNRAVVGSIPTCGSDKQNTASCLVRHGAVFLSPGIMKTNPGITAIFGNHDEKTLAQARNVAERAAAVALMADGHLGYVMPIGGVAAYRNLVSPVGVGFDIACGVAAMQTDLTLNALGSSSELARLADAIQDTLSFGIGRRNMADDAPVDHPLFDDPAWNAVPASRREELRRKARQQLGTIGSGNHFVDVLADDDGAIWIMAHFGSRGLGHTIASAFLALGQGKQWGERVPETEVLLDLDQPLGQDYWALMELAGTYAYAGREWVVRKVAELMGAGEIKLVHQHHNSAWKETHDLGEGPEELVVVRKGATPAFPGQAGAIGGSMGDDSVIVEGTREADASTESAELQRRALYSTVHGAGRVMSRTEAAGKRNRKTGAILRPGRITREMLDEWLKGKGVILRGGGLDEAPMAYRRLTDVLAAQGDTIRVRHVLRPLVVVMAGDDVRDPYKD